jgi:hypothetical protein
MEATALHACLAESEAFIALLRSKQAFAFVLSCFYRLRRFATLHA